MLGSDLVVGFHNVRSCFLRKMSNLTIVVAGIECLSSISPDYTDPYSDKVGLTQDAKLWAIIPGKGGLVCLSCSQLVFGHFLETRAVDGLGSLYEKEIEVTQILPPLGLHANQPQSFAGRIHPALELPHVKMVLSPESALISERSVPFEVRMMIQVHIIVCDSSCFVI